MGSYEAPGSYLASSRLRAPATSFGSVETRSTSHSKATARKWSVARPASWSLTQLWGDQARKSETKKDTRGLARTASKVGSAWTHWHPMRSAVFHNWNML